MNLKFPIVCSLAILLAACAATDAAVAPSSAPINRQVFAEYPRELHGLWMPKGMGCPTAINYDSEFLLSIDAGMLGQYENTSKPLRVEQTARQPPTWHILSTFSPGTGEYEGEDTIIFTLGNGTLSIRAGDATTSYTKCK
ncbi:hypothetical protein [Lysobacter fragariae]